MFVLESSLFMNSRTKYIAHLDLDCFFVSVERIKDPMLAGKPVIVGGSPSGRGVVASASYEARKFGVRSAMPAAQALRLCPNLICVRGHYSDYTDYSDRLYKRVMEIAPVIERVSIDEMNMDFTGCEGIYNHDLPGFMKTLQALVLKEFSLPCTIGLASNKTIAKIAATSVKPAGVRFIPHGEEAAFLAPLPVDALPGIGVKTAPRLIQKGFRLVSDLQRLSREQMSTLFGRNGDWLFDVSRGKGSDTIHPDRTRKSIGREETFAHDLADTLQLDKILHELVEDVCATLRKKRWKAKTITLKLRYSDFKTLTHAITIKPTQDDAVVFTTARNLLHSAYKRKLPLRLIGVSLRNFEAGDQEELILFHTTQARDKMLDAVNDIRKKFGKDIIHVGGV
jgi:DNA polymerase-4